MIGEDPIFLTGGTGFFGPFLLKSLLEQTRETINVLVRAENPDKALLRLREALGAIDLSSELWEAFNRRVNVVCGDLGRPLLGMTKKDWDYLSHNCSTIFHNGAMVNYLFDYPSMRQVNVGGTQEVVRFAASQRGKVLNHISTTFIFGWSKKEVLWEQDSNRDMQLLDFGYSQSKWVSEQIVHNAAKMGFPVRVFRPALTSPSLTGGGYNFDISVRLMAFILKYGISTTASNQVSFTPADIAANNIVAISNIPESLGKNFMVTRDEFASMQGITAILAKLNRRDLEYYSLQDFVPEVVNRCTQEDLLFPLLNFLILSVDNISSMEFKRYDNSNYRLFRDQSASGIPDPPLEEVVNGINRFLHRQGVV